MCVMSNQKFSMKYIKEGETNSSESLSPGRCSTEHQRGPSRHCTTAKEGSRRKWYQEVNQTVNGMLLQQQSRSSGI